MRVGHVRNTRAILALASWWVTSACGGAPIEAETSPTRPVAVAPPALEAPPQAAAAEPRAAIHVPIRSVSELRVMTFNLRMATASDGENHWDRRAPLVFDLLRSQDPDVVALQEDTLTQIEQLLHAVPRYAAIGVGTDGGTGGEHVAILYRMDRLEVQGHGVFWLSETPTEPGSRGWGSAYPRICTWARLRDRRNDLTFLVYATHLDHRSTEARARGLAMIAEHIRAQPDHPPAIVAGDLNLEPDDEALARFLSEADLVDAYRGVHPEISEDEATYHGFRGDVRGERIDFILASGGVAARDAEIVRTRSAEGRYPSDHYPVTTTLHLTRTE